MDGSLTVHSSQ